MTTMIVNANSKAARYGRGSKSGIPVAMFAQPVQDLNHDAAVARRFPGLHMDFVVVTGLEGVTLVADISHG